MNTIRFDRRRWSAKDGTQAYYHKDYPRTMFWTIEKKNRKLRIDKTVMIIDHESLHDVLTRKISEQASHALDNKWPKPLLRKLVKELQLTAY